MKPRHLPLIALLGLVLATSIVVIVAGSPRGQGPVYALAAIQPGLERDPQAWMGRTVLIHTIPGRCIDWVDVQGSSCVQWSPELLDAEPARSTELLPLTGRIPGWLTFLRRLPLLGRLAPLSVSADQAYHRATLGG